MHMPPPEGLFNIRRRTNRSCLAAGSCRFGLQHEKQVTRDARMDKAANRKTHTPQDIQNSGALRAIRPPTRRPPASGFRLPAHSVQSGHDAARRPAIRLPASDAPAPALRPPAIRPPALRPPPSGSRPPPSGSRPPSSTKHPFSPELVPFKPQKSRRGC
jgi:hypothetical protein